MTCRHRVSKGGEGSVEASYCQHIVISWTNLHQHIHQIQHHCHHNLKLIKDSHIGLLVKVLQEDVKTVIAHGGDLVNSFKTKPDFA